MMRLFVILMIAGLVSFQAQAQDIDERKVAAAAIAKSLLKHINAAEVVQSGNATVDEYIDSLYTWSPFKKTRIALWPFRQQDIPVPKTVADEFNAAVLAQLIKQSGGRYEFVARDSLRTLIADMNETGALDAVGTNPITALMKNAQDISILIEGKLTLKNRRFSASYKAVRLDSTIVAATDPVDIRLSRAERNADLATLSLNQAITAAAKALADKVPKMKRLRLDGVRFETSGLQPDFGRYALDSVSTALQDHFSNVMSGQALRVEETKLDLASGEQAPELQVNEYLLSGTYWDLEDAIELRVSLKAKDGKSHSWSGRIRTDSLRGLEFLPDSQIAHLRDNDNRGPIEFSLTTDRGKDPRYRLGDKLNMAIGLSRDSWVYCFYKQADGSTVQIFPNPHFWTKAGEARLAGDTVHIIPGENLFPFELVFRPPVGQELLKCFAASSNVTPQLPESLRGMSLDPLPRMEADMLSQIFQALPKVAVSEASVAITVTR